ncbi:MAG: PAS domain S-box protein [Candidatus Bathyarchaeota archaeon]|nr:PAS domain S-box protein [Candidatus Bathyarchaeota archaeon]
MKAAVTDQSPQKSYDENQITRILCVDDEQDFLGGTKTILELEQSFHVDTVLSVKEALQKMASEVFDVIVSDYLMPGKNGLEFLKTLRENGNQIPFILFTGKGREEVAVKALNLGADRYFNKFGNPETVYGELVYGIHQAVAQRRAEKRIWDREERLRAIIASSPDSMIVINLQGNVTDCNLETLKLLEFSKKDIIGKHYLTLVAQEHHQQLHEVTKELFKNGFVSNIECSLVKKNGSKIPVEYSANLLRDAYGNIAGGVSLARDITEHKKAEEALKNSEEKFRNLADQSPNIIFINIDRNILYVNKKYEEVLGYTLDELSSDKLDITNIMAPEDVASIKSHFSKHRNGEEAPPLECSLITKKGKKIDVILTTKLIKYHEQDAVIGTIHDITKEKKVKKQLREQQELLELVTENVGAGIAMISRDFQILWMNDVLMKSSKAKTGKPCYSTLGQQKSVCPDCPVKEVFETEKKLVTQEKQFAIRGESFVEITATPIRDKKGNVTAALELVIPITKRKKAEDKLKDTLNELETANQKLGVLGKLTRHDIKNKLSTILNNTYLARKQLANNDEALTHLVDIELTVDQIEKIFEFSRLYEQLGTEKLSYIKINKKIEEAILLQSSLEDIKILNKCNGLTVKADSLLRQVFYNLIENSLKHGQTVNKIEIYYKERKNDLKLIYKDNGVGIPEHAKELIFKEGYGSGTGYGLHLIRKICEGYGWSITEKGTVGKGTKFVIVIPKMGKNGKPNYIVKKE